MKGVQVTVIVCQECGAEVIAKSPTRKYCVDCVDKVRRRKNNANNVIWRKENPEKCRQYVRGFQSRNPEKKKANDAKQNKAKRERRKQDPEAEETNKAYMANYFQANKDRLIEANKQWNVDHPEEYRLSRNQRNHNRRAKVRQVGGKWKYKELVELCEIYDNYCCYCHKQFDKLTADHMIPISRNGANTMDNIIPACLGCNSSKHDKTLLEFASTMVRMNPF